MPVSCGGVLVLPGDVIVGDAEGVVVVPAQLAEEVARDAAEQELVEQFAFERVDAGESTAASSRSRRAAGRVRGLARGACGGRPVSCPSRWRANEVPLRSGPDPRLDRAGGDAVRRGGAVDLDALAELIEWQIESGSHGISVHGSTGEPSTQSVEEREAVLEVGGPDGRRPGALLPRHRQRPSRGDAAADREGRVARRRRGPRDHALLQPPDAAGAVRVVSTRSRASSRICRWSSTTCPSGRRSTSRRETVGPAASRAREHRRHQGDDARTSSTPRTSSTECGRDFLVYCGIELLCYPMLTIGGVGHLSCVANVAPKPVRRALRRVRRGRLRRGAAPALRAPPARRHGVPGDESRPREVGHGAGRRARLRGGAAAAGDARRRRAARRSSSFSPRSGCWSARLCRREPGRSRVRAVRRRRPRRARSCTTSTASSAPAGRAGPSRR